MPYITSCWWPIVITQSPSTVSKTLPFLHCTWLPMTLRSPSLLSVKFKSQATCTFWIMYKHVIVHAIFPELWVLESDISFTLISHTWFPVSLPLKLHCVPKKFTLFACYKFDNFWQKCYWENKQSKMLYIHLTYWMLLHYLKKCWSTKIASFLSNAVLLHCRTRQSLV